jgi:hypothetical protein
MNNVIRKLVVIKERIYQVCERIINFSASRAGGVAQVAKP